MKDFKDMTIGELKDIVDIINRELNRRKKDQLIETLKNAWIELEASGYSIHSKYEICIDENIGFDDIDIY